MNKNARKLSSQDSLHSSISTESEYSPKKSIDNSSYRRSSTMISNELSNARIIQSKLVYIINLPESIANEELLKSKEYFGQYGTIVKCAVNKSTQHTAYQAYITFTFDEEAAVCIKASNKFVIDGNELTVTFGTTKYCNYFLRGNACPKPDCLYLHAFAPQSNIVPREVMPHTKHIQPIDSLYDGLKIQIAQPQKNSKFKLPSAKVIRERAYSEQIHEFPKRKIENQSRFDFIIDGDVNEVPLHMRQLRKLSSAKDEVAEIPIIQYDSIMSYLVLDSWHCDILEIKLEQEKFIIFSKN